ncbi:MAG: aconitate hydratase AcnA [Acidobacteria bacterium]|jgi:aconitate hydratase|nr:aconitate hydratase AcnA [Acidobacteriota bacterium]MDP7478977.1 aconitate hydratase AcnA [Vicinamibacterales bacterium]MDP7690554.1 aconitate hydratase AcnA [Vicinamibacterales bacterium]HJN45168.1 aconitate hydratase AcnA [Vicinamibacterales bacterium]
MSTNNTFGTRTTLSVGDTTVTFHSLETLERAGFPGVARLPYSLKILLENLLRREDGHGVTADDVQALASWNPATGGTKEIAFMPSRVLLQDFTGVPAVVDLAAMRDGVVRLGGDPERINPLQPAELVIDHSVQVDHFREANAFDLNAQLEFSRNKERYAFLKWGQQAFDNFRVVPPDTGIVHQVNLEYLARVVCTDGTGEGAMAYPDTLVGTDSHTTMVNGLGVVGWGVGGIEAEAAMLGQPISMLIPEVVGFKLIGRLPEGTTTTDLVLTITELLRQQGVVGKFVEFFGPGLASLTLADRATLGNMSPEYGSTVAICPIDQMTIDYLTLTGRDAHRVALVDAYARAQGMFGAGVEGSVYAEVAELELGEVEPSIAGPKRPQDRVPLGQAKTAFAGTLTDQLASRGTQPVAAPHGNGAGVDHGAVVIAAITSCTNTSNPSVMIAAGLLAQKAAARGLKPKPWVKTSLAPGSLVVTEYLEAAGLMTPLAELGFGLVGYGCTTCIGNSGPLPDDISAEVKARDLVVASVLSGNRNFEGRVQPQVRANYLASPPLVVAYALAGRMTVDLTTEPLGQDTDGIDVFLRDIWPSANEVQSAMAAAVRTEQFTSKYAGVFEGDERWRGLAAPTGQRFAWDGDSTYVRHPPFFESLSPEPAPPTDVIGARVLALLGDSVTTDHISPAGAIPGDGPAGTYLISRGVDPQNFNSFGSRRGNHEVMMRGTFANIRLRNQLAPGTEGGWTRYQPDDEEMSIYDAAMRYRVARVGLLVLAGKEYGSGSSRDWAAKGTMLLGVRAVIAESFERIHRSNLVFMGVLPLQFRPGDSVTALGLTGREAFDVTGIADGLAPRGAVAVRAVAPDGTARDFTATVRIDTPEELHYYRHGGILQYVLRQLVKSESGQEAGDRRKLRASPSSFNDRPAGGATDDVA